MGTQAEWSFNSSFRVDVLAQKNKRHSPSVLSEHRHEGSYLRPHGLTLKTCRPWLRYTSLMNHHLFAVRTAAKIRIPH